MIDVKHTTNDTLDESRSREQYGVCEERNEDEYDVNMLTTDITQTAIDSSDESKNRSGMLQEVWETNSDIDSRVELKIRPVGVGSDDSDESSSRTYPVSVGDDDGDESGCRTRKSTWLDDNVSDESSSRICGVRRGAKCSQLGEEADTNIASDASSSRGTRCSMSNPQQPKQPVTPVIESGSIAPTTVNIDDVDKCLVTNKHANVKQDSTSMSNQWLSNTFSVITSGILGKNKSKTGKEVTENVNTNSKAKLIFKPEFNFFL